MARIIYIFLFFLPYTIPSTQYILKRDLLIDWMYRVPVITVPPFFPFSVLPLCHRGCCLLPLLSSPLCLRTSFLALLAHPSLQAQFRGGNPCAELLTPSPSPAQEDKQLLSPVRLRKILPPAPVSAALLKSEAMVLSSAVCKPRVLGTWQLPGKWT